MKTRLQIGLPAMLFGAMLVMAPRAMALTEPCTQITNSATLSYSVNSEAQADKVSNDGVCTTGNNCAFYVGAKVGVTVATTDAAYVSVTPGGTGYDLHYTITNDGNATMKFDLTAASKGAGSWDNVLTTAVTVVDGDTFDMTTPVAILDADNGDADLTATPVITVTPGATRNIKVHADAPLSGADTNVDVYSLVAQARWVDSDADVTTEVAVAGDDIGGATCNALGATTVEVVLADAAGDDDNGARKGDHSARSAYKVVSAAISVAKTVATIWDPVNFNSSAKPIPEAITEYTITVSNAASGAEALLSTITDSLDVANLTLVPTFYDGALGTDTPTSSTGDAFIVTCSAACGSRACEGAGGTSFTAATADGIVFATPTITATMGTVLPDEDAGSCTAGSLDGGDSVTIKFQTTIN